MTSLRTVGSTRKFSTLRAIGALVMREMSSSYGKTPGGYLWAVLEPVGGIIMLTLIFSLAFRSPPMGTNFAIFYATGVVPFMLYNDIASKIAQALGYSRQLLVYPSVTFFDAIIARFVTNMIAQLLVVYIVFFGIVTVFDTRTDPDLPKIALSISMAATFGLGVGMMNCFLFNYMPIWQKAWAIINRPLFIISCVIFLFDSIPQPYRDYLWYNPLVHVVGQMRAGFYPSYHADYVSLSYVFGVSLTLIAVSLALLLRYHRDLLDQM
ncbi:ABC transporter permease [Paracoccus jeotgali]|uniref:Transport permease protein n=1 Tax=Paracoccus jeotgali TaxID=2065379 RepID=A0A2K9MHY5_9RHOB|nr:ABC transporter permease [Paracoccus jeotgali]AUM75247.1 sugar ABC transporter permease [Paracoccus jeotgali]